MKKFKAKYNKEFVVNYTDTVHYDTVIKARSKQAAIDKVREVVGDVAIESVYEHKSKEN
jgi:hypothetical protein